VSNNIQLSEEKREGTGISDRNRKAQCNINRTVEYGEVVTQKSIHGMEFTMSDSNSGGSKDGNSGDSPEGMTIQ